jgi:hypothetical protein
MNSQQRIVFLPSAIERHQKKRNREVKPEFLSLPRLGWAWGGLLLLLAAGAVLAVRIGA